jgi:S1-C subfamily serine protease
VERDLIRAAWRPIVLVAVAAMLVSTTAAAGADAGETAAGVKPGVVDINTTLGYKSEFGAGTGIVLSSSGVILTNNHVIRGATSVRVTDVDNGQSYPAIVVGYDIAHDIAVLKLTGASGLKRITLGSTPRLEVGEAVKAIGNAGGVGVRLRVASGRVTALHRPITARDADGTPEPLRDMIETNAPTQAGDSGGPLIDAAGRVVGINTAGLSGLERPAGQHGSVAYAIPIAGALSVAHLIESGRLTPTNHIGPTPLLGVDVLTGAGASSGHARGVRINLVLPGSPAQKAGLAPGDLIIKVGNKTVSSPATLTRSLLHNAPKDNVAVVWINRAGATRHGHVHLGTGPSQ